MNTTTLATRTDGRLTTMLCEAMNTNEQQLFVQSFQQYTKFGDDCKDFVVNLDDVYGWLDFAQKRTAVAILNNNFSINVDYICDSLVDKGKRVKQMDVISSQRIVKHGGQNKQTFMMTIDCFKGVCLLANTSKAKDVRGYYIKMEAVLHKYTKICMDKKNALMLNNVAELKKLNKHIVASNVEKKDLLQKNKYFIKELKKVCAAKKIIKPKTYEQCQSIYVMKMSESTAKVGKSKNRNNRLHAYTSTTDNKERDFTYSQKCSNIDII